MLRLGLKCKVGAERTLKGVLAVPKECIKTEAGKTTCKVLTAGGKTEERTIVVGPSNDKLTMVVEGLKTGDEVVIEEKK